MRFTMLVALAAAPVAAVAQSKTASPTTQQQKTTTPPPQTKAPVTPSKTTTPPATQQQKAAPPPATQQPKTVTAPANQQQKAVTTPANPQQKAVTPPANQKTAPAPQTKAPAPQTKTTPAAGAPQGRGVPPATRDTAIPLVLMREVFDYNRDGRRDPFISLLSTTELRPTLGDLKLLMTVVDEPGRSVALVQDGYERKQKTLRVGSRVGRMRVSSIRSDAVVFTIEEFGTNRRDSLLLRPDTSKTRVGR
jgi:hypothetical protein